MTPTHRVIAAAAAGEAGSLAFLRALIRAGETGESAVQEAVARAAAALDCDVETLSYSPSDVPMIEEFAGTAAIEPGERRCVTARRRGSGGGRSLVFFAHPDSEPPSDLGRWRHGPFAGEIDDGRLYGWGVADDLAGMAVMVEALRVVKAAGLAPRGDVVIASTPSKRHARGVSALLHAGLSADAAVYLHPAESGMGMGEVKAFASGQVEFRILVDGKAPPTTEPLQTAFAHLAVNPVDKALVIAEALRALDVRRDGRVHHPLLEAAVGRSTNLMISHIASGQPDRLARVPATCVLGCALAFPPGERLSTIQAEVEQAVAAACAADPWLAQHPATVVWDAGMTGADVPADHPLFVSVATAVRAVTGHAPVVNPMHTGSDIRNPIVQKGIPTVGLGPLCGDLSQNGSHDEWVDVADYLRAVAVAACIIAEWCGVD